MSNTIWLYWEGPMPAMISLCCKTVFAHNENVVLLDRAGFDKLFVSDRDINIDALAPNHKSDFIRAYLLKHYGGLYVDADCIVMRNLAPLLEKAEEMEFVGYRETLGYMSCNFMASLPEGSVISDHYREICATLRGGKKLEWLDLASTPMERVIGRQPGKYFLLPTDSVMPLCWTASAQLAVRRSDDEHEKSLQPEAWCYMLSHNTIKSRVETRTLCLLPESQLLNDNFFLSYLFRQSLGAGTKSMYDVPPHLGGHENLAQLDEGALDYLTERFSIRTMVDVGCGPPGMVYYARSKGIKAVGVDGDPSLARDCPVMIEHDYTKKPLFLGEFDLGWAVEFLEHVEEQYIANFMATFDGCRYVFVTHAVPGQPGHHHVNCQPSEYWIAKFAEAGFKLDPEATDGVRKSSTMWSGFTKHTGLVFVRQSE